MEFLKKSPVRWIYGILEKVSGKPIELLQKSQVSLLEFVQKS